MNPGNSVVHIVDDDRALRESLCFLIESADLPARAFESAAQFLDACDAASTGCLLLDIQMPEMTGLVMLAALPEWGIHLPVIMITGHGDVPMAVRAMKDGAFDFFEKPFNDEALLACVRRAIDFDQKQRRRHDQREAVRARLSRLTSRERQVLEGVIRGRLNKQIAEELDLSEKTIESHRANLMRKMQAENVVDLVKLIVDGNHLAELTASA